MKKGIIGRKLGMTQLFDEKGKVIPVTVISAGPCVVVQKRTNEKEYIRKLATLCTTAKRFAVRN